MPRSPKVLGTCPLCLRGGVEIQRSHLVPAGAYRRLRSLSGKHPALVKGNKFVETSRQTWAHLLCASCELRFSESGEKWVLQNGLQQDTVTFPLLAHLMGLRAISADRTLGIFQPAISSAYDPLAIGYFAISVFWRASVSTWGQPDIYPIKLGPYKEELRRYLLGEPFPQKGMLMTIVRAISPVNQLTYHPSTVNVRPTIHLFVACGFVFILTLGANVFEQGKAYCILTGQGHPITVTNELEVDLVSYARRASANA